MIIIDRLAFLAHLASNRNQLASADEQIHTAKQIHTDLRGNIFDPGATKRLQWRIFIETYEENPRKSSF